MSLRAQSGIGNTEAIYQRPERAKALVTRALPWKERLLCLHEERTLRKDSMREDQLLTSRSPLPMSTPKMIRGPTQIDRRVTSMTPWPNPQAFTLDHVKSSSRTTLILIVDGKDFTNRVIIAEQQRGIVSILWDNHVRRGARKRNTLNGWGITDVASKDFSNKYIEEGQQGTPLAHSTREGEKFREVAINIDGALRACLKGVDALDERLTKSHFF